MFIFGLGLGMVISAVGGAIALYTDNKRAVEAAQLKAEIIAEVKETHYHVTVDEEGVVEGESDALPPAIADRLKPPPKKIDPATIDWSKVFGEDKGHE